MMNISEKQITLEEMLAAREKRYYYQKQLLHKYPMSMICFTMNIAGPQKNSNLIYRGFLLGKRDLERRLSAAGITPAFQTEICESTGNEAYYLLPADLTLLKKITTDIEDASPIGRLFDMDVLNSEKKIDRTDLGLSGRKCLICGGSAKECARSRSHSILELQKKTTSILLSEIQKTYAKETAAKACRALLYEVCTSPKPGLVDRFNTGSHKDMDIFTFITSTCTLSEYFEICTCIGMDTSNLSPKETFAKLRAAGRKAEADMFAATNHVNTHKGAIFSIGILCGAIGRLLFSDTANNPESILKECAAMTKDLVSNDFATLKEREAVTVGEKLYISHGITGIRGQIEEGIPVVLNHGLPVLKEGLLKGLSINDAGCCALLSIMVNSIDTNIIARSNIEIWKKTISELKKVIEVNPYPSISFIEQLDREFIASNLSPGGSADLLAITYFLYFLESEA